MERFMSNPEMYGMFTAPDHKDNQVNKEQEKQKIGREINVSFVCFLEQKDIDAPEQSQRVQQVVESLIRENVNSNDYVIYTTGVDASPTGQICHDSGRVFAQALRQRGMKVREAGRATEPATMETKIKTRPELRTNEADAEFFGSLLATAEAHEVDLMDVVAKQDGLIIDLWGKTPKDPRGTVETPHENAARYQRFVAKMSEISRRSPKEWPPVTVLVVTNIGVNAWATEQTGIPAAQTGRFSDFDTVTVKLGTDHPTFNLNGAEYDYSSTLKEYNWEQAEINGGNRA